MVLWVIFIYSWKEYSYNNRVYLQLSEIATYHKEEKTLVFILYKIISTAKILKKTIEYTTYEMGKYV